MDGEQIFLVVPIIFYFSRGFVTDHVQLLEDHSKLYLYLQAFETDPKRKLAMQSRRIDMLQPLLSILSKSAYDTQHKQVIEPQSYVCFDHIRFLMSWAKFI